MSITQTRRDALMKAALEHYDTCRMLGLSESACRWSTAQWVSVRSPWRLNESYSRVQNSIIARNAVPTRSGGLL